MQRVVLFVGAVALAVALGIAVAPYIGWVLAAALVLAPIVWAARRSSWRVVGIVAANVAILAVFAAWSVWLFRRGQAGDAVFVAALYVVWVGWHVVAGYRRRTPVTAEAPRSS